MTALLRVPRSQKPRPLQIRSRMLRADGKPALEFLEAAPEEPSARAPILFIHGAFGGAWMWREIFMPYFAGRGRAVAALSLRGHGRSEGRAQLREAGLSDYLDDVCRAFAEFAEPPIVVAHSLGGLLAQMLIGRETMRGLALLGSLPPEGMMFTTPRLAATDPHIFLEAMLGTISGRKRPVAMAGGQVLFSEGLPSEDAARYAAMMTPEAPRALAEAHLPHPVMSALMVGLPALVIGGMLDRLVWRASTLRTALYHGGEHQTVADAGHFLQFDLGAEEVARRTLTWIEERGL